MTNGMVCAPQPEAVEAGVDVLRRGGNAIDAAIATALTQTVVDPFMCGIAGFGVLHYMDPATSTHLCLDFHARAPKAARPDMWRDLLEGECEDGFGFILKGRVNEVGYQAIATPESLGAYDEALRRFGTMPLGDVIGAAIQYAEDGWRVRPHVRHFWTQKEPAGRVDHLEYLRGSPATAKIYLNADGGLKEIGDVIRNPDMAATYRRLGEQGARDFYEGGIAGRIAADMAANGGLLTLKDLRECGPEESTPLRGTYRGYEVVGPPPPAGGVMVLQMLNILENFDLAAMGHNSPDYIRVVAEAMKISTVDKDLLVGDPRFVDVPVERILDKAYAADCAERIKSGEVCHVPRLGQGGGPESRDTTHICVVDGAGRAVSLTHSLGMPSGVTTDGLGFIYNGCMSVFDPRPGNTGSLAPGKARFTSMAPMMLFKDGELAYVIGAPGGTYIAMGVLQGILNYVDFAMKASDAVAAPRFSATSDIIEIVNRIPRGVEKELNDRGYATRRYPIGHHFAGVHAIRVNPGGALDGGADPGRDGVAMEA